MKSKTILALAVTLSLLFPGCGGGGGSGGGGAIIIPGEISEKTVLQTYARIGFEKYSDAVSAAQTLLADVTSLVESPTSAALSKARNSWRLARERYLVTEAFRFQGSPIDDSTGGLTFLQAINIWPVDPKVIDAPSGSGSIVNDGAASITTSSIESIRNTSGFASVTGFHAIEVLLFGSDGEVRTASEFVEGDNCGSGNCVRRGQLLVALTDLLVADLTDVKLRWDPDSGSFGSNLSSQGSAQLRTIMEGIRQVSFEELAAKQLNGSVIRGGTEQSPFSGTSYVDVYFTELGIEQTILGKYRTLSGRDVVGPSIVDLLTDENERQLAADLRGSVGSTLNYLETIFKEGESGKSLAQQALDGSSTSTLTKAAQAAAVQASFFRQASTSESLRTD